VAVGMTIAPGCTVRAGAAWVQSTAGVPIQAWSRGVSTRRHGVQSAMLIRILHGSALCAAVIALGTLCLGFLNTFGSPIDSLGLKKENNKTYIVYKVENKQPLYSILKHFNLSLTEFKQINPEVNIPINSGEIIFIPIHYLDEATSALIAPVKPLEKVIIKKTVAAKKPNSVAGKKVKEKKGSFPAKPSPKKAIATKNQIKKTEFSAENGGDDGLPTLNKVLAAYAKSTGPKGKIGDIN
jgi:hypothetical protein